jgi:hypothetical protein
MCSERVSAVQALTRPLAPYRGKSSYVLQDECVASCSASKARGLDAATRYYQTELPERIAAEKQTLAHLTSWSLHDIDAMPDAQRFSIGEVPQKQLWWQKLFAK